MSRKKNIFSMYRVLLLAATLPLVAEMEKLPAFAIIPLDFLIAFKYSLYSVWLEKVMFTIGELAADNFLIFKMLTPFYNVSHTYYE
jgi:hypothetical protein